VCARTRAYSVSKQKFHFVRFGREYLHLSLRKLNSLPLDTAVAANLLRTRDTCCTRRISRGMDGGRRKHNGK